MTSIAPSVGRKLYFHPGYDMSFVVLDPNVPLDATILFTWPADPTLPSISLLNVMVVDHVGNFHFKAKVPLVQDGQTAPENSVYAYWMPYQVGQAAKTEVIAAQLAASQQQASQVAPTAEQVAEVAAAANIPAPVVAQTGESSASSTSSDGQAQQVSNSQASDVPETPVHDGGSHVPNVGPEGYSLDFGGALSALREGKAVTRAAWNANSNAVPDAAFVYLVPANSYPAQTPIAQKTWGTGVMVPYHAYLAMRKPDNTVVVFTPDMDSILAQDWKALDI